MKTRTCLLFFAALTALAAPASRASVAVVSNLEAVGETTVIFRDSHGVPLGSGCAVQLVTFGNKTPAEIAALAAGGPSALMTSAVLFGAASSVGTGSGQPGTLEFAASAPLIAPLAGLHAVIFNAATPAAATELLVVSLPGLVPADSLSGLDGYLAVHFEDGEVVFGGRTAAGFSTRPSPVVTPTAFDGWIRTQLGEDSLPADRLAGADPDRDGVANLLEYAMGSGAVDGSSRPRVHLRRASDGLVFVQYLRRTDDPGLSYQVEHGTALEGEAWSDLESAVTTPAAPPFPAPADCAWVEQALPAGGRGFVRVNVEMAGEVP